MRPERWWWLSFADEDGFRGVCIVRARGLVPAIARTHLLGINPGGEVQGAELPEANETAIGYFIEALTPFTDRLLTRADLALLDAQLGHRLAATSFEWG